MKIPFSKKPTESPAAQALTPQQGELPPKVETRAATPTPPQEKVDRDVGPHSGTGNAAQVDRRNAIADSLDQERIAEGLDIDPGEKAPVKVAEPEPDADDAAHEPTADAPVAEPVVAAEPEKAPEDPDITLKVNGRDVTKKRSVWLTDAAKVESADQYLQASKDAARIALKGEPSKLDVQPEKSKDLRALARAIQVGTEDEAEQALRQLVEGQPSATPDVAQLVDQRLSLRDEKAKFDAEYADVLSDPNLRSLVLTNDEKLAKDEPELPFPQRWRKAGEAVREWKKGLAPTSSAPLVDKAARKAEVAPVPTAAGRQAPKQDDEGTDDPQAVIAEMAKKRGQGHVQH